MNLSKLLTYDTIFFDNRIYAKGALKNEESYYILKNKLVKSNLYVTNVITFYLLDAYSAIISVNLKKEDFFNTFGFIPSKECLDYAFCKFMPSRIYLENVSDIMSNIELGKFDISIFESSIEQAFSNPLSIQKIELYPYMGQKLKFTLELYITLKVFEAILKLS